MAGLACVGGAANPRARTIGDTHALPNFAARTGARPEPRWDRGLDAQHYGTLNHLPRETFLAEAKLAADLEGQSPGILRKIADSMGMADDFAKWEA